MIDTADRTILLKRIAQRDLWNLFICGVTATGTFAGYVLVALLSSSHLVWAACGSMSILGGLCVVYRVFVAIRSHHCLFLANQRRDLQEWRGY